MLADDSYVGDRPRDPAPASPLTEPGIDATGTTRLLWTPEHPNLVDADGRPCVDDEQVVDEVRSYAGLRRFAARRRPVPAQRPAVLRCGSCSRRATGRSPTSPRPTATALRREVELIKELGFNGVRIHQKVEDPRFLYWCDRLGLLVWGEMPSACEFSPTRSPG